MQQRKPFIVEYAENLKTFFRWLFKAVLNLALCLLAGGMVGGGFILFFELLHRHLYLYALLTLVAWFAFMVGLVTVFNRQPASKDRPNSFDID